MLFTNNTPAMVAARQVPAVQLWTYATGCAALTPGHRSPNAPFKLIEIIVIVNSRLPRACGLQRHRRMRVSSRGRRQSRHWHPKTMQRATCSRQL